MLHLEKFILPPKFSKFPIVFLVSMQPWLVFMQRLLSWNAISLLHPQKFTRCRYDQFGVYLSIWKHPETLWFHSLSISSFKKIEKILYLQKEVRITRNQNQLKSIICYLHWRYKMLPPSNSFMRTELEKYCQCRKMIIPINFGGCSLTVWKTHWLRNVTFHSLDWTLNN